MEFTHSTREACKELRISDRTLLRLRRDGVLRPGDHYRAAGAGLQRPTLLWNVPEVEKALARRSRRVLIAQRPAARPCSDGSSSGRDVAAPEQEPGFFH
ncbi:MAG: hypothetical protein ACKOPT_15015 [Cyanobium sp.]